MWKERVGKVRSQLVESKTLTFRVSSIDIGLCRSKEDFGTDSLLSWSEKVQMFKSGVVGVGARDGRGSVELN